MEFGKIRTTDAEGAVLGHSVSVKERVLKKGTVLDADDIALLGTSNIEDVYAARLAVDDVGENDAAAAIGVALAGEGVTVEAAKTGRCNLFAREAGIAVLDAARIAQLNQLDESLTIACLFPFERVEKGQMLATVKIIPYAVPKNTMNVGLAIAEKGKMVELRPFVKKRVGLIITRLADTKSSLIEKTEQVMAERVKAMGSRLGRVSIIDHSTNGVSLALNTLLPHHDLALIFGASAIVDRADVVPIAVSQVGGEIEHLGMPVDPGNLLLLAKIGKMPVIGVPTCARSPKLNGFDWVLERLLADIAVLRKDLQAMGVGGLLKEIPSRPLPRESQNG